VQFARDNPAINVVGIGAGSTVNGDSLDGAFDFMTRFGADAAGITMIYDVSFQAWRPWGVSTQPWMIVLDETGERVFEHAGRVDLTGAVEALGL